MFKSLGQTWRSIASVVIAYFLVVLMFFYAGSMLNEILGFSNSVREFVKQVIGDTTGPQGNFLFTVFFSEGTFFITFMILLARVLILSAFLWIGNLIVEGLFGKAPH
jgi:hypothetical protein